MLRQPSNTLIEPSSCGHYLAKASSIDDLLEIYDIPVASSSKSISQITKLYRSYDLRQILQNHLGKRGTEITISQLEWEILSDKQGKSDKLGIVIDSCSILIVLDIRTNSQPIIIEQTSEVGVEYFQWIPSPLHKIQDQNTSTNDDGENNDDGGAYFNSKQIAIFTKNRLEIKLYSLDCTHLLFTIPKPISTELLIRPNMNNRFWSIICEPYFSKNSDVMTKVIADASHPIMYHFYNHGSTSELFYKLRLPIKSSTNPDLYWSQSGKWLMYFNYIDTLFGFDFHIFNSLGIYRKPISQDNEMVNGDDMISLNWLTDGIVDDLSSASLISIGSPHYFAKWISIEDNEYVIISSQNEYNKLDVILISTANFKIESRSFLPDNPITNIWKQSTDRVPKYRKTSFKELELNSEEKLVDLVISKQGLILFRFTNLIIVYELVKIQQDVKWNSKAVIRTNDKILSVEFRIYNDKLILFITTEHQLLVYDQVEETVQTLLTNKHRLKNVEVFQDDDGLKLLITDESTESKLNHWRVIHFEGDEKKEKEKGKTKEKLNENLLDDSIQSITSKANNDDSNLEIMKKYQYNEDDSKVVNLMRDVQHTEWGKRARIRRNRFSDMNLAIPPQSSTFDEITDTFNLNKKPKI